MTNINCLNEDCLLLLFDLFFLDELFHLRLVSPRWYHLIERHRFLPLKTLKLFGTPEDVERYSQFIFARGLSHPNSGTSSLILKPSGTPGQDDLIVCHCRRMTSRLVVKLFPNVETLVYYSSYFHTKRISLNYLLRSWPKLSTLLLKVRTSSFTFADRNRLSSLKSLYILDDIYGCTKQLLANVAPQLEHFWYDGQLLHRDQRQPNDNMNINFGSLKALDMLVRDSDFTIESVVRKIGPQIVRNLTRLSLTAQVAELDDKPQTLKLICDNMPALEYLNTTLFQDMPMVKRDSVTELAKLTRLKELFLDPRKKSSQLQKFGNLVSKLPQLRSIETLQLTFHFPLYRLIQLAKSIDFMFPGLKLLTIDAGHHLDASMLFGEAFHGVPFGVQLIPYLTANVPDLGRICRKRVAAF